MYSGFAWCHFICNQGYRDNVHKFFHIFSYPNWFSPMYMLSLYKQSEVMYQHAKNYPSHSQNIIEYIRGINFEKIFFKPICRFWFNILLGIHNTTVPSKKVKICFLYGCSNASFLDSCNSNVFYIESKPSFLTLLFYLFLFTCLRWCNVCIHHDYEYIDHCHHYGNDRDNIHTTIVLNKKVKNLILVLVS